MEQKILFVTGKGGVGKSLVAAAIAYKQAQKGQRVLLAEIGETSYYQDFWGLNSVGHKPQSSHLGFDLALWSGESCLREYVLYFLRMERLYKLFFENKVMRSLVNVAPGLSEIAILGKITSGIREVGPSLEYDLIVVDAYATGHALALFRAPQGMMQAIQLGPMGKHSRDIDDILKDPQQTSYVIVTLLEELPVVESLELGRELKKILGVQPEVVCNKVLNSPLKLAELASVEAEDKGTGLGEFASYLKAIVSRQNRFLDQLKEDFKKLESVPLIFSSDPDELVKRAGEALRAH